MQRFTPGILDSILNLGGDVFDRVTTCLSGTKLTEGWFSCVALPAVSIQLIDLACFCLPCLLKIRSALTACWRGCGRRRWRVLLRRAFSPLFCIVAYDGGRLFDGLFLRQTLRWQSSRLPGGYVLRAGRLGCRLPSSWRPSWSTPPSSLEAGNAACSTDECSELF